MSNLDLELVRHALGVARGHGFAEVELGLGEDLFHAKLDPMPTSQKSPHGTERIDAEAELVAIGAPLVGYFHQGPVPLAVGLNVRKDDIVAEVVALGIASDVQSHVSGEVVEVLVHDGDPVQYGQPLARVRPQ